MKREPSIHITETQLEVILDDLLGKRIGSKRIPELVIDILTGAKKYQLSNRKLLATNKKATQKANVIAKSPLEDAMLMAKTIYMVRRSMKHRGIEIAKPNTRDFTIIKTIASHAIDYLEHRQIPIKQPGFTRYVEVFFKLIGKNKFNLIKLQNSYQTIVEYEDAILEQLQDENPGATKVAYNQYNRMVIKEVGELLVDYKDVPEKYKFFIDVSKYCMEKKIDPGIYIIAQFKGLEWAKGIPDPNQLIGPKALERLQKYLYEIKGKNKDEEPTASKENVNKLKSLKKLK